MTNITPTNEIRPCGQEEESHDNPVWEELSPMIWRNAIYSDEAISNCMGQLFIKEVAFFEHQIEIAKEEEKKFEKVAAVEVGMGTAELFSKTHDDFDYLVGVEISQQFIDCAFNLHEHLKGSNKVRLINGNAVRLTEVLKDEFDPGHDFWSPTTLRLTCMCMNTFGILPEEVRRLALKEMFRVTGPGGKMIIGCWHRDSLRTGFLEFYSQNPHLCGECKEADFDFEKGNFMSSSTDYTSHWWTQGELQAVIAEHYPGDISDLTFKFEVHGVGIFAIVEVAEDAILE